MINNNLKPIILIFGILTFFIFVVSFSVFYATEHFTASCGCRVPSWVIIVAMASLGLFVGLITYYILSTNYLKKRERIEKDLIKILDLLDNEDNIVLKKIIESGGEINQSSLTRALNLDKVRVSRIVSRMEEKNILKKEKNGMTNKLILDDSLKRLFLK